MMALALVLCAGLSTAGCGEASWQLDPEAADDIDIVLGSNTILGPSRAQDGESVGLVFLASPLATGIQWHQSEGPAVSFHAAETSVIGFDVPSAGTYKFVVSYNENDQGHNQELVFTATKGLELSVQARLDREVSNGARVGVAAVHALPGEVSFEWIQVLGPAVAFEASSPILAFQAPILEEASQPGVQRTLLRFQVRLQDAEGHEASDMVSIVVKESEDDGRAGDSYAEVHPYNREGEFANALVPCLYTHKESICTYAKLPRLGMTKNHASISQIMDRVVVSHDWMGKRFREFLEMDQNLQAMRAMMGAVTGIVISYDIKPSYYKHSTGALHLDPMSFWHSPSERDTLRALPDYRDDFGTTLQFQTKWRYVHHGTDIYTKRNRALRESRTATEVALGAPFSLYHELTHANDYFPPQAWQDAEPSDLPMSYFDEHPLGSRLLSDEFPLASTEMRALSDVLFRGHEASAEQRAYSPVEVSSFFAEDRAVHPYAYRNAREDYATLVTDFMLYAFHDVEMQVALTSVGLEEIAWGETNRIGHARIKERIAFVLERILPHSNWKDSLESLPTPVPLTQATWFEVTGLPSGN